MGSPAYSKALLSAFMTMWFDSPLSSTVSGMAPAPSPSVVILNFAARSTLISFQMSRPRP